MFYFRDLLRISLSLLFGAYFVCTVIFGYHYQWYSRKRLNDFALKFGKCFYYFLLNPRFLWTVQFTWYLLQSLVSIFVFFIISEYVEKVCKFKQPFYLLSQIQKEWKVLHINLFPSTLSKARINLVYSTCPRIFLLYLHKKINIAIYEDQDILGQKIRN